MSKAKVPFGVKISGVNYGADLAPPAKKLEAQGWIDGNNWDDGVNDNVRKITVRYDGSGVNSVVFKYAFGTKTVDGYHYEEMPKSNKIKKIRFADNEYIISVEGQYGKKLPRTEPWRSVEKEYGEEYMTMLTFKTNITTYPVFGTDEPSYEFVGTPFTLKEEGYKIVGFYGKSTHKIRQIGAYVKPIDDA